MRNALFELRAWIRHRIKAGGPHQVHSPLVFKLLTEVLKKQDNQQSLKVLNDVRRQLRRDEVVLEVKELGAGSRKNFVDSMRKVKDIAQMSLQNRQSAEALFRITGDLKPALGLELGTSLGLTTAYLALASPECRWISVEGVPQIAQFAVGLHKSLDIKNVTVINENFDDFLPKWLQGKEKIDFACVDGNHLYEPTMRYFNLLCTCASERAIFIFDDIHWSPEMEMAWKEIQNSEKVSVSIDFFHFGVVYFRGGIEKQHFVLRLP